MIVMGSGKRLKEIGGGWPRRGFWFLTISFWGVFGIFEKMQMGTGRLVEKAGWCRCSTVAIVLGPLKLSQAVFVLSCTVRGASTIQCILNTRSERGRQKYGGCSDDLRSQPAILAFCYIDFRYVSSSMPTYARCTVAVRLDVTERLPLRIGTMPDAKQAYYPIW